MQDSTLEAPIQETPAPQPQSKSGKGWMICTIILAVLLVAGGAFAAMIIAKGNRDTNKLAEVEQQLKEKEAKISELEKKDQGESTSADDDEDNTDNEDEGEDEEEEQKVEEATFDDEETVKSELDSYIANKRKGYSYTYKINKFSLTSDKKYYYAYITVSLSEGGHESSVEYRAAKGGRWAYVNGGQSVALCSDLDSGALDFMKTYGKEVVNYMTCYDGSGVVNYGR